LIVLADLRFESLAQLCHQFCHHFFGVPLNRTARLARFADSITLRQRIVFLFHRSISFSYGCPHLMRQQSPKAYRYTNRPSHLI